jgi:hypothetical protein
MYAKPVDDTEFRAVRGAHDACAIKRQKLPRQPIQWHAEMRAGVDVDHDSFAEMMHGKQAALAFVERGE